MLLGLRREQQRLDHLGPGQERTGVPPPGQVGFPRMGQTRRGVLTHRLVEAEPGPGPARVRLQQRSRDQLLYQRADLLPLTGCVPATSWAAAKSKPPGNTLSLRNITAASAGSNAWLQVRHASSESWRPRPVLLAGHSASPSPLASSVSEATRRRLATSSIASGNPAALRQMLLARASSAGPA